MDFKGAITGRLLRVIAMVTLLVGLGDAAVLLGVTSGAVSPLQQLGAAGFVYLSAFCLARLFAAVGLWIGASWGAVLLVGATVVELLMFAFGNPDVRLDVIGFVVRVLLVASIVALFVLGLRQRRAHD